MNAVQWKDRADAASKRATSSSSSADAAALADYQDKFDKMQATIADLTAKNRKLEIDNDKLETKLKFVSLLLVASASLIIREQSD